MGSEAGTAAAPLTATRSSMEILKTTLIADATPPAANALVPD